MKTIKFPVYATLLIVCCFWLTTGCEQDTIATIDNQTPVIEGYIFAGQAVDSIRVTQSIAYSSDGSLVPLDDLDIVILTDEQTIELETIGNGYYQHPNYHVQENTTYTLSFNLNDETIAASTFVPSQKGVALSHTEIRMEQIDGFAFGANQDVDPIEITWDNSEGDYYYVLIENITENPEYINLTLQEIFENEDGDIPQFGLITEPQIVDSYSVNTRLEIQQFGVHRVIVYRVNPEYAALYESASNSSLSLSEPPSNVENGLGIFTGISSDTVYFEVKKL